MCCGVSNRCQRQPITIELMHIIFQSLNFSDYNHTMFWAACCLGFFGFLGAGEFTVNSPFNPDIHLAVSDVQADSLVNPSSFRIHIKCFKTDPFRQGCHIYIGAGKHYLCPVRALTQYLHIRGSTPGPLFLLSDGTPLHRQWLTSNIQSIFSAAGVPVATPAIASALAKLLQQPLMAYQITSSRRWADGPAMRIRSILALPSGPSWG